MSHRRKSNHWIRQRQDTTASRCPSQRGEAIKGRRNQVIVATKVGIVRDPNNPGRGVNGTPNYVRKSCEGSLKRLGVETIDLYYQHRVDPNTPIEDTVGAMAELVKEGKVRYLGLSEASPKTLKRAVRVHPIAALQSEYSLWTRDPEDEVLPTCRDLGIGFVAYSPLGRGFLTGNLKPTDLAPDDFRRTVPCFRGENFDRNAALVSRIEAMAKEKYCKPAQLALAWVRRHRTDPRNQRRTYLKENVAALEIRLTDDDLARLDELMPQGVAAGLRYPDEMMKAVNQ